MATARRDVAPGANRPANAVHLPIHLSPWVSRRFGPGGGNVEPREPQIAARPAPPSRYGFDRRSELGMSEIYIEFPGQGRFSRDWLEQHPERAQQIMASCADGYPNCLCVDAGLPLYIAKRARFYLARIDRRAHV